MVTARGGLEPSVTNIYVFPWELGLVSADHQVSYGRPRRIRRREKPV